MKSPYFRNHKENLHVATESRKDLKHKTLADGGLFFMTEIIQIERGAKRAVFFPLSQELSILLQRSCQKWEGNISCKTHSPTKPVIVKAAHFTQSQVTSNIHNFHLNHRKSSSFFLSVLSISKGLLHPTHCLLWLQNPRAPETQWKLSSLPWGPDKASLPLIDSYLSVALPRIPKAFEADRHITNLSKNEMTSDDAHKINKAIAKYNILDASQQGLTHYWPIVLAQSKTHYKILSIFENC